MVKLPGFLEGVAASGVPWYRPGGNAHTASETCLKTCQSLFKGLKILASHCLRNKNKREILSQLAVFVSFFSIRTVEINGTYSICTVCKFDFMTIYVHLLGLCSSEYTGIISLS